MTQGKKQPKQPEPVPEPIAPFLGRELRVELTDGRILVGALLAYEGSGDLLLQGAIEERTYQNEPASGVTVRGVNLVAIPFKCVKSLHRRKDGVEPLAAALEAEMAKATEAAGDTQPQSAQ